MSDLVIGEGVALDLRLAKLPSRALAKLLDLLVQAGLSFVAAMVLGLLALTTDEAVATGLSIVLTVAIIVGYPVFMETVTRGRTLGKMALGLRVVRNDGGPIKFRHALVRALVGVFDFLLSAGLLAVITSFCSKQGKRPGDFLAGTVVVRDRTPDSGVSPAGMAALAMPYPLLGWAQGLDLAVLPDDVALAARQYLTRMHEMRPEVAARMGYELANEVARYVQVPPAGTPPWAYLAAVTAERRARQMRKAEAERAAAWARGQAPAGYGAPYGQQYGPAPIPMPYGQPGWQGPVPYGQPPQYPATQSVAPYGQPPQYPTTQSVAPNGQAQQPGPQFEQLPAPPPVQDRVPNTEPVTTPDDDGFKPPV